MGLCREFGPRIHPDCGHPMRPGDGECACPECGVRCTGRFAGCPDVWQRAQTTPSLLPPGLVLPLADDEPPELAEASSPVPSPPPVPAAWPGGRTRSRRSALVPMGVAAFVAALLLSVWIVGGRAGDTAGLTAGSRSRQTPAAVTTPPSTVPEAPTTTAAPATTAPPVTQAVAPAPEVTSPPAQPRTTTAPVRPRTTTAPARAARYGPLCGFSPGAPVDVQINGRPAGASTADRNGCVSAPRTGR